MRVGQKLVGRGELARAATVYQGCLAVLDEIVGAGHEESDRLVFALGELHEKGREFDDAEACYVRLYQTTVSKKGAEHPAVAQRLASLAHLNLTCGRLEEARQIYEEAARLAVVSHNPLASFDIGYGLSRLFRRTESWSNAIGVGRSLLGLCKDLFEKGHPMALFIDADLVVAKANAGEADRESAVAGVAHIWKSLPSY